MKLAISNIAWQTQNDQTVYHWMRQNGYTGLEIAPTRVFPEAPYDKLKQAQQWSKKLWDSYGFVIPSMQSIWYGRQEKLFGSPEERVVLLEYTKKAIQFASIIGCRNLVFGCPRNRQRPVGASEEIVLSFFHSLGEYALQYGTIIGLEANPPMYQTNYINDTASALELIKKVDSKGFLLNLDVGTMIASAESISLLEGQVSFINHVHISEPGLKPIMLRKLHLQLAEFLRQGGYRGYVSIEMGRVDDISIVNKTIQKVKKIFVG